MPRCKRGSLLPDVHRWNGFSYAWGIMCRTHGYPGQHFELIVPPGNCW